MSYKIKNFVERCVVKCSLDGVKTKALWDTGAQLCVISRDTLAKKFPNATIVKAKPWKALNIAGISGINTYVDDIVFLKLDVKDKQDISVPFYIMDNMNKEYSIVIGYNVITHFD